MNILKPIGLFLSVFVIPLIMYGIFTNNFKWYSIPISIICIAISFVTIRSILKGEKNEDHS